MTRMRTIAAALTALVLVTPLVEAPATAADTRAAPTTTPLWGVAIPTSTSQVRGVPRLFDSTATLVLVGFDRVPNRLFWMASDGSLTHMAGNGSPALSGDGGPATAAGIGWVRAAVRAANGDVYLTEGSRVRRVAAATGVITTVAGGGTGVAGPGFQGPALSVSLSTIDEIEVSGSNVWIRSGDVLRRLSGSTLTTRFTAPEPSGADGAPRCTEADAPGFVLDGSFGIAAGPSGSVMVGLGCDNGMGGSLVRIPPTGPLQVVENFSGVARPVGGVTTRTTPTADEISGNYGQTCVVTSARNVACRPFPGGVQSAAQLVRTAGATPALLSDAAELASTSNSTCARQTDGDVWCWGFNLSGELGDGTTTRSFDAVPAGTISTATQIEAYNDTVCALLEDGTVSCWGDGQDRNLGNGSVDDSSTPVSVTGLTAATALGRGQPCAAQGGQLWCWGSRANGWLGDAGGFASGVAVAIAGTSGFTDVRSDPLTRLTCALSSAGALRCWGYGPSPGAVVSPAEPVGLPDGLTVTDVAVGYQVACAVLSDTTVWCWGQAYDGVLGNGSLGDASWSQAVKVTGLSGVADVEATGNTMCARTSVGEVYCWGSGQNGATGAGSDAPRPTPVQVDEVDGVQTLVGSPVGGFCAIDTSESVSCWGALARRSWYGMDALADGDLALVPWTTWIARDSETGAERVIGGDLFEDRCLDTEGAPRAQVCISPSEDLVRPNGELVTARPLGMTVAGEYHLLPAAPEQLVDGMSATSVVTEDSIVSVASKPDGTVLLNEFESGRVVAVPASGPSAGLVTTAAGTGVLGVGGIPGPATAAQIPDVHLATDSRGNVIMTAADAHRVVRLAAGQLTVVAGTGVSGDGPDGPDATAVDLEPVATDLADDGTAYVLTRVAGSGFAVRKVSPAGALTTIIRDLDGPASFDDIHVAPDGSLVLVGRNATGNLIVRMNSSTGAQRTVPIPTSFRAGVVTATVDGANDVIVAMRDDQVDPQIIAISPNGSRRVIDPLRGATALAIDRAGNLVVASESTVVRYADAVHGVPDVPTAPRAVNASSPRRGTIRVTWAAPFGNGYRPITDYVVQYRKKGATRWRTLADGVSTRTTAAISGLDRDVRFEVRVIARNALGRSVVSRVDVVRTR